MKMGQSQRAMRLVALMCIVLHAAVCVQSVRVTAKTNLRATATLAAKAAAQVQALAAASEGVQVKAETKRNFDTYAELGSSIQNQALVIHNPVRAELTFGGHQNAYFKLAAPGDGSLLLNREKNTDFTITKSGSIIVGAPLSKGINGGRLVLHYHQKGGWGFEAIGELLELSTDIRGAWRTAVRFTKNGDMAVTGNFTAGTLKSKSDVTIDGDINIDGGLYLDNVRQWQIAFLDDFAEGASGWSKMATSTCGNQNQILGGHCNFAGGEVQKHFKGLPPHEFLRLKAVFHFIDRWEGEMAFAQVDGAFVWTEVHTSLNVVNGINMCGKPDEPETKMGVVVDVVIPHTGSDAIIGFGSSLDADPCESSWGVDNVFLLLR
eukprot:GFYU01008901.1.p1 GENE.GFYU01008901.1~~GFYU01008901.1.p1  ORF type:complete len:377 (+),score=104.27 GFYU01008901.1:136-1266(+)